MRSPRFAAVTVLTALALGCAVPTALAGGDACRAAAGLIVHEWGTFTSFAGSDGVELEFVTDPGDDLPSFVYTRARAERQRDRAEGPALPNAKFIPSKQRMETPVTYFYTGEPMEVEVAVRFPDGLLTEFYPRVREHAPLSTAEDRTGGLLRWGKVRLIPPDHAEARGVTLPGLAPDDDASLADHYLFARETDSALVRVCAEVANVPTEHEKFLFYRGLGTFSLPLRVVARGEGRVALQSVPCRGTRFPIGRSFVFEVAEDLTAARLAEVDHVGSVAREVTLPAGFAPVAEVSRDLSGRLVGALVDAGLYEKEALAMVRTWERSWFESPGLRVLYLLPQSLTDELLPLEVSPRPAETVRVLLGRAEVLTPERERSIEKLCRDLGDDDYAVREAASRGLARMGRFAGAALSRIVATSDDFEARQRARELLERIATGR